MDLRQEIGKRLKASPGLKRREAELQAVQDRVGGYLPRTGGKLLPGDAAALRRASQALRRQQALRRGH